MRLQTVQTRLRMTEPKTIVAAALVFLMAMLWLRVLTGNKPSSAQASSASLAAQTASAPVVLIEPVALPSVVGRNDTVVNDFFAAALWPASDDTADKTPPPPAVDPIVAQREAFLNALPSKLVVDAIIQPTGDEAAKACLDGKVYAEGQTFVLKQQGQVYEVTVWKIEPHRVLLTSGQKTIVLPFADNLNEP